MKRLRIAMLAPPWLKTPPEGYGGTEFVVHYLCRGLRELGVEVELFGLRGSTSQASRHHWHYEEEQYQHIHKPLYDAAAIPVAHVLASLRLIKQAGNFDLIHDHNHLIGPALIASSVGLPPALHTLHGPFATADRMEQGLVDCTPAFGELARSSQVHYNGISEAQLRSAPQAMRPRIVGAIHHGIDPTLHLFQRRKGDYFVNVGRMAAEKGIATAARLAAKMGAKLKLGGVVAGITDPAQLAAELSQPDSDYQKFADFVYFRDQVAPQMQTGTVEYVGAVAGLTKDRLIGGAKAFLMPIEWEEPFGVAIIDALVCGTPVVAMRRGSLPEIIEHGVNGFLADNEEEFAYYMTKVDEIDPAACRRSVEQRFSYRAMAGKYLTHYKRLIGRQSEVPVALPAKRRFAFYERLAKPAEDVDQAGAGVDLT